jgi:NADH:quinone reductase (non-electrogenic)
MRRVVIIGGGFGGVKCAKALRTELSTAECEIVLFNRENHMVFHPLLAEVAGASIEPDAVAAPLRQFLRGVRCRTEVVTHIDLEACRIDVEGLDGHRASLGYDHLVIACGRSVNLGSIPGMADHAFALKTVGDAMAIRAHVIQQLEAAEHCDRPEDRRRALSFIVVGGGYSGVELAGEINDLVRSSRRFYPGIAESEVSVTLVHSGSQILPEIGEELREFARRKMEKAGVTMLLNSRASAATADGLSLKDGRRLEGRTIVCTIGTSTPLLLERIDAAKDKGTLVTGPDMRLAGRDSAWAIGDCARIINAEDGKPCAPTGQFAERQGRQVAMNIARAMRGEPTRPFRFKALGQLCAIGGRNAVAEMFGIQISGFLAWITWRTVYLMKLPSWSRRVRVGGNWFWDLLFPRDLMTLKTDRTEAISHAFYRTGDYIFREGDPALSFYTVDKGEIEVVRGAGTAAESLVAVLGAGEFFGEMALLENRPRGSSVRARTDVEVTVIGAQVFSRLGKALTMLQKPFVDTVRRRTANLWLRMPDAHAILASAPIGAMLDHAPTTIGLDASFDEALETLARDRGDFLAVVDAGKRLAGVLTRTDLLRAIDRVVTIGDRPMTVNAGDLMSPSPISVTLDASPTEAAALMWGHGLKSLPVVDGPATRRVVGTLRAEGLMMFAHQRRTRPEMLLSTH